MSDVSPTIAAPLSRRFAPLHPSGAGARPTISLGGESAIFLHTGWRSGGTWIWSQCRESSKVHGYYEPLHEQAARFRRRDIATMRPGSWHSNHSDTPPYFAEYRDLIPPGGRGVALYQDRFAFDRFFRDPDEGPDPELESYLQSLMAGPVATGRLPVFKFCRSLGRVGWFEQRFPQAMHAVVLRDPLTQFRSAQRLLVEQRNRYFALAPLLVLAKNAQHPAVRQATASLGVRLPPLFSNDMAYGVEICWRHVKRQDQAERYRAFLAFWTLCALSALDSDALLIDMDIIRSDTEHRLQVETALRLRIGDSVNLHPRPACPDPDDRLRLAGIKDAHQAATALALAHRARLTPNRLDIILAKLASGDQAPGAGARVSVLVPSWQTHDLLGPTGHRSGLQRLATAAMVLAAQALQPLRRLHGRIVRGR